MAAKSFCQHTISVHVWRKHKEAIQFNINTVIFQHLVQENLIPIEAEAAQKICQVRDYERRNLIVDSVPKCSQDDFLVKFIACLRATVDDAGEAHTQLADLLENDYTEMMEKGLVQETFTHRVTYDAGYCFKTLTAKWKRSLAFCSSFLWLLLGAIGVAVLTYLPVVNESQAFVFQKDSPLVNVNLSVDYDPFWFSAPLFSINISGYSTELYVLPTNCASVPTIETTYNHNRYYLSNSLTNPPYYLLESSQINITIRDKTEVWSLHPWFDDCSRQTLNTMDCDHPKVSTNECVKANASDMVTFNVNTPGYYAFCSDNGIFANNITFNMRSYNSTAVQNMTLQNLTVSSKEKPVHDFVFHNTEFCLIMNISKYSNYISSLQVTVALKKGLVLIPILIGVLGFILHIILTIGISCFCHIRPKSDYDTIN